MLELDTVSVTLRGRPVLRDVTLRVGARELVGLVGPNGAGKTTLLRAALGLVPFTGNSSLVRLAPAKRAREAAYLPQAREIAWPVSVEDLVMLGRLPHRGAGDSPGSRDRAAVEDALRRTGLVALRHRAASRLSGGEQARALIARAFAQDTPLLLADEPTAGLDPAHQIATMRAFAERAAEGRAVVVSLHDLGLAARHCTRLVMLAGGRIVADGPPVAVLRDDRVADIFGVTLFRAESGGGPVVMPLDLVPASRGDEPRDGG